MVFRAKRTSENMALALFCAVILYFIHGFMSEISFGAIEDKLISLVFAAMRLLIPVLVFTGLQKNARFEKISLESSPKQPVISNIRITFIGFSVVFVFGIFYGMAFPSAAVSYAYTDPISMILTFVSAVAVPAFLEEYLYRELFCRELTVHGNLFAIISSALLFGLMHFSYYSFPYAFICGLVIGFVYLKTGSVKYTIALHFAQNLFSYVLSVIGSLVAGDIYFKILMGTVVVVSAAALPTVYFLIPSNYGKFTEKEYGNVTSSAFLTFPMVILIACILILNFI
ncbi:MAG: CPBP family intramembrane metalloprotease [Ruminococcaceae bacterium]|nr:CPBP family intramembrane metalloprotease [Oscillospiraceae bacterium]